MRRRVKKNAGILAALCLFCCASCHDDHDSSTAPRPANTLTLDDVYAQQIMRLIGREIVLYEDMAWSIPTPVGITGYPLPSPLSCLSLSNETAAGIWSSRAWLNFESADQYIDDPTFRNQYAGSIDIVSASLLTVINAENKVEKMFFQGKRLKEGRSYYLTGVFQYASSSLFELPPQGDEACLEELNQIKYWPYIFEFRLTGLSELPPQ